MSETISDIVREMRHFVAHVTATGNQCRRNMMVYADRIEAAAKAQTVANEHLRTSCQEMAGYIGGWSAKCDGLKAEVARLRDALVTVELRLRVFAEDNLNDHQRNWLDHTRKIALDELKGGAE